MANSMMPSGGGSLKTVKIVSYNNSSGSINVTTKGISESVAATLTNDNFVQRSARGTAYSVGNGVNNTQVVASPSFSYDAETYTLTYSAKENFGLIRIFPIGDIWCYYVG